MGLRGCGSCFGGWVVGRGLRARLAASKLAAQALRRCARAPRPDDRRHQRGRFENMFFGDRESCTVLRRVSGGVGYEAVGRAQGGLTGGGSVFFVRLGGGWTKNGPQLMWQGSGCVSHRQRRRSGHGLQGKGIMPEHSVRRRGHMMPPPPGWHDRRRASAAATRAAQSSLARRP